MRVLSPHPGYELQIFEGKESRMTDTVTGQGYTVIDRPALNAKFISGAEGAGLFPHELAAALAAWDGTWKGLPEETNPIPYISVYDTEAQKLLNDWTDEYHQKVCERLRFLHAGRESRMMLVEDVKAVAPFPAYDSKDADEILAFLEWSEGDPALYYAYEYENQRRPELLDELKRRREEREAALLEGEVIGSVSA